MTFFTVCIWALTFLLQLKKKVKAKPKKIPKKVKDVAPGTKCVVTGWGTTDSKDTVPSDKLQMLEVTVVDRDQCNRDYKRDIKITKDMMCAGNKQENRGTCWVCHNVVFDLWLLQPLWNHPFNCLKEKEPCFLFLGRFRWTSGM